MQLHPSAAERVYHAVGRFVQVTVPFLLMVLTALAWLWSSQPGHTRPTPRSIPSQSTTTCSPAAFSR